MLFLSPKPFDQTAPGWDGVPGPAIEITRTVRGCGDDGRLKQDRMAISGAAILLGDLPDADLLLLAIRLPVELARLTPVIIQAVERDAARGLHNRGAH
jgi:hypothetical protein